jgi:2-polyprenyl-3-methyl-5-hydroxy-6-metoxy-1,4-benzoquinol methylase
MDVTPRSRVLRRMTDECLRLTRAVGALSNEAADACIEDFPSKLKEWLRQIEDAPADSLLKELPGQQGYALWAESYDDDPDNWVIRAEEEHIWDLVGDVSGKDILDVGSGTGRHAVRLAEKAARVVASEPNEALRGIARSKTKDGRGNIEWLNHPLEALPSAIGQFDLVLCCLVLSHIEDLATAVSNLSRFVKPGGSLLLSDFHPFNLMIGWRTSFRHAGRKYVVPNYLHLPSEYFTAMTKAEMCVEHFLEVGSFPDLPGQPATIILKGRKGQ